LVAAGGEVGVLVDAAAEVGLLDRVGVLVADPEVGVFDRVGVLVQDGSGVGVSVLVGLGVAVGVVVGVLILSVKQSST